MPFRFVKEEVIELDCLYEFLEQFHMGFLKYMTKLLELCLDRFFYLLSGGEKRFKKRCIQNTGLSNGKRILDLCCGNGDMASMISQTIGKQGQIIGVDIDTVSLNMARSDTNSKNMYLINAESGHIPISQDAMDICFVVLGMHHMTSAMRAATLSEVYRILKPGGRLYIVDYSLSNNLFARMAVKATVKIVENDTAYQMLIERSLCREVRQAGFYLKGRKSIQAQVIQIMHLEKGC